MSIFDGIIIAITLILAVKGFFNGFIKEIAGLIGIVGGLFLASTYYHSAGVYINENLLTIKNPSAIDLVGFVAVFVGFWVICVFIGFLLTNILKISALGIFDRILGFFFAGAKFFILVSIIVFMLYKIEFIKEKIAPFTKNSIILPFMLEIGDKIIHLKPEEIKKDIQNHIKDVKIPINNLKGD